MITLKIVHNPARAAAWISFAADNTLTQSLFVAFSTHNLSARHMSWPAFLDSDCAKRWRVVCRDRYLRLVRYVFNFLIAVVVHVCSITNINVVIFLEELFLLL